jgi:hypothetical protein
MQIFDTDNFFGSVVTGDKDGFYFMSIPWQSLGSEVQTRFPDGAMVEENTKFILYNEMNDATIYVYFLLRGENTYVSYCIYTETVDLQRKIADSLIAQATAFMPEDCLLEGDYSILWEASDRSSVQITVFDSDQYMVNSNGKQKYVIDVYFSPPDL